MPLNSPGGSTLQWSAGRGAMCLAPIILLNPSRTGLYATDNNVTTKTYANTYFTRKRQVILERGQKHKVKGVVISRPYNRQQDYDTIFAVQVYGEINMMMMMFVCLFVCRRWSPTSTRATTKGVTDLSSLVKNCSSVHKRAILVTIPTTVQGLPDDDTVGAVERQSVVQG